MADEWKKNLKVGDRVVLMPSSVVSDLPSVHVVEKVTAQHFVLGGDGGRKWRREGWGYVGRVGLYGPDVREPTPELIAKVEHLRRAAHLSRTAWNLLPFDVTARAFALLNEPTDGK
jgi:hypothetical protein